MSLTRPYPIRVEGDPTHKITLECAVEELANQAGVTFDATTSRDSIGAATLYRYIYPSYENEACASVLRDILQPLGLKYRILDGKLVLEKK